MPPRPTSLLCRLDTLTLALSLLLILGAVIVQIVTDRRSALNAAVAAADTDARLIREHANVVFRTANRLIDGVIAEIGDRSIAEVAGSDEMRKVLSEFANDLIDGGAVGILDRDGTLMLTTSPSAPVGTNFADRVYFQAVAGGAPFTFGRIASGRTSGEPIVILAKPIGIGAAFRGAVMVGMRAAYFAEFYASIALGPKSSIAILRDDGLVLAREPTAAEEARAQIAPTMPVDRDHMISIGPSSIDRTERIAAMRRVPGQPLIVSAALSLEEVLAPWRRRSIALGGLAALVLALLGSTGYVALRADARERAALQEARKLSQELAVSLQREQVMRRELVHRTKNNLAMMIAMLRVEARHPNAGSDSFAATANRITALALAQQSLDHSGSGDMNCAEYLGNIAYALADAEPDHKVKLRLALESIALPAQRAQALGLIANELMTNSIKYAFVGRTSGTVTQRLRIVGREVVFEYEDDGPGFTGEPRADSQGLRLISGLCSTLKAQHTISGVGGLRFRLSFPRKGETLTGDVMPATRADA
jgi:two-component sensor histidine kinase